MRRPGDLVAITDCEGATLIRRIVGIQDDVLLICTDEEYAAAKREKRTPVSIGFKVAYVVRGQERLWPSTDGERRHARNAKRPKG